MNNLRSRLVTAAPLRQPTIAVLCLSGWAFAQSASNPGTKPADTGATSMWGGNLLHNGSFEDDDGWSRVLAADQSGTAKESDVLRDDQVSRAGTFSVRLSGDSKTTKWFGVESEPIPVRPGNTYRVSGWIRTKDVQSQEGQFFNSNLYVQFRDRAGTIILTGKSPVRVTEKVTGTTDWKELSLVFNAPQYAEFARVGCALTCSGTAWFDDLGFFEAATQAFTQKETSRFVFFFVATDVPTPEIISNLEAYLTETETLLGVTRKELTRYFKYPDEMRKLAMTGNSTPSHIDGADIHTTSWDDRVAIVGALMNPLGSTSELLGHGLAVYCATTSRKGDVHEGARRAVKSAAMPTIVPPSDPSTIQVMPAKAQDALYGSFVGWLIQEFGITQIKRVYAYPSAKDAVTKMPARFKTVYGITIEDAERRWKDFLLAESPAPKP